MGAAIWRLIIMLACVCHLACCVWWYIGTVNVDTHAYNYGHLMDMYEVDMYAAPDSQQGPYQDVSGEESRRQLLAGSGAARKPVDPNQPPYDESVLGVYEPPGRAFIDSWVFYYQGLGEEDIWSDECARWHLLSLLVILYIMCLQICSSFVTECGRHVSSASWFQNHSQPHVKRTISCRVSILKQYAFTFYWATTTLSTAGLVGYTTPKNEAEIIFVIVSMLCTLTIYTYVLGALHVLLTVS